MQLRFHFSVSLLQVLVTDEALAATHRAQQPCPVVAGLLPPVRLELSNRNFGSNAPLVYPNVIMALSHLPKGTLTVANPEPSTPEILLCLCVSVFVFLYLGT